MQEEVENRTVTLTISGAKLTGRTLKWAIRQFLNHHSKSQAKKAQAAAITPRGKQSVAELVGQNQGVQNIEISDKNIKDFDRVARKYGIDYAVKKDTTEEIPKYLVFFKARDGDALNAAFREYSAVVAKKKERPSVIQKLCAINPLEQAVKKDRVRHKDKGAGAMRLDKKLKKKLLLNAPYVLFVYLFDKAAQGIRLAPGADASQKLLHLADGFGSAFASPLPSFHPIDLLIGIAGAVIMWVFVYVRGKNAKKFRKNTEYGSARWGTPEDIEPYMDPDFRNNIILTQTERLTMNSRPKDPKTARNKNVLVIGGSGSGKTRFFVKPQLMQLHSSYVVTDPKGSLLVECGRLMERAGYKIKVFNTINFKKSMHYNPFAYIHSEKDILKLVNTLITNTKGEGKGGDDFWLKAETLLYTALIGYIYYEAPKEEQNFATLVEFINAMEVREDDETFENNVDIAFRELGERDPNHFAVRQWRKYKLAAGKTAKSINISAGARLAPFDIQELREITMYDELELDTLGGTKKGDTQKTVLFLIMSDTDSTFNFLISMIYSQLFNLLCEKADDEFGGRLPIHVRCLIDECANIGQIPNLEKLMATIRSREISACLVLQAQSQLKALYKDSADTIIGNCDTSLFLGGKEPTTLKELNQTLGKETIDTFNTGESRGREVSHSLNYQKLGKDLATVDELAVLDGGKCILQLRGVRPFLSDKYDITKHPNYKYLSDADKRNEFDIERFLSRRLKPKPDEVYDVYDIDASVMDAGETAGG